MHDSYKDKEHIPAEDYDPLYGIERENGRFVKGVSGNPAGRPRGSKNIYSRASVKKLESLGMDPIEELSAQYDRALDKGDEELAFKIMSKLIEYGYSKTATMSETKVEEVGSFSITTTKKEDKDGKE